MVDPILRTNPYIRGALTTAFPGGRTAPVLLPCSVCKNKGVPYAPAPFNRAWTAKCLKCGAPHVFRAPEASMKDVQKRGAYDDGHRLKQNGDVDATKRYRTLREMRDLGDRWWRR